MTKSAPIHDVIALVRNVRGVRKADLRELQRAATDLDQAPPERADAICYAISTLYPALASVVGGRYEGPWIGLPDKIIARLILGAPPVEIYPGLTPGEAHNAIQVRCQSATQYLLGVVPWDLRTKHVLVARWVRACWIDPKRRAALEKRRTHAGPHGEAISGCLADRLDEIAPADLVQGEKTSVRIAFERATTRMLARWEQGAQASDEPLAPPPRWWRPVKYARLCMTRRELAREGREMSHCVALYAPYVAERNCVIVSIALLCRGQLLRSTAEISRNTNAIVQHKGPNNEPPHPMCKRALDRILRRCFRVVIPYEHEHDQSAIVTGRPACRAIAG